MEYDLMFLKMEDDLIFLENGRQPQFEEKDDHNFLKMEDDLNFW